MTAPVPSPRQARSEQTLFRLEQAAIRLLEAKTWNDLTLAELVTEARSSIGSFYNLFRDKEALLDYLDEQYTRQMIDHIRGYLERRHHSLEAAAGDLFGGLVAFHRARRGLIRALVLRARSLREPAYDERTERMNDLQSALRGHLHRHCPDRSPEEVLTAFSFGFSALRDRVLFPESIRLEPALDDKLLTTALTRQLVAFLES